MKKAIIDSTDPEVASIYLNFFNETFWDYVYMILYSFL